MVGEDVGNTKSEADRKWNEGKKERWKEGRKEKKGQKKEKKKETKRRKINKRKGNKRKKKKTKKKKEMMTKVFEFEVLGVAFPKAKGETHQPRCALPFSVIS